MENQDKATFSLSSEDSFLSPEERKVVKRLLSHPEDFPQEFWGGIIQKIGVDGLLLPQSQVQGLKRIQDQGVQTIEELEAVVEELDEVVQALGVIGDTYTDEETSVSIDGFSGAHPYDPTVSVPAGTYFCILTGQAEITAGGGDITMRMFNGETDTAFGSTAYWADSTASGERQMLISIGSVTLTAADQIRMYANETGNGNRLIYSAALVAVRTS